MKIAILIILLIQTTFQQSLERKGTCKCNKYTFQQDCQSHQECQWVGNTGSQVCLDKQVIQKTYCNQISADKCQFTFGCAYLNNSCVPFAGCSAYFRQTSQDCQLISRRCISDQIKCVDVKPCASYDQKNCSLNSNSGTTVCVWENNVCRDQICTEAPKEYSNDVQCNTWLKGCITNGKGCILPPLQPCDKYTKMSSNTNSDYCDGYLGVGGICTLDGETQVCRLKNCDDYKGTSDQECDNYQKGCVTIGTKCATRKLLCSEFTGDDISCKEKVGSDGKCFKSNFNEGPCELRKCDTADPSEVKEDKDCENYQKGCKYTGSGCVQILQKCSSYEGTKDRCSKLKGSDGFCERDNETTGQCQAKLCSKAPNTYKTNAQCQEYQIGCTSNGNGCVSQSTCLSAINSIGCSGIKSCEWNDNCSKIVQCSDLTTLTNCVSDLTFFGIPKLYCKWKDNACTQLTCKDAILEDYTDTKCTEFLIGCVSNGIQCLENYLPCDYYTGTQSQCAPFKSDGCWNDINANSSSICRSRQCIDDQQSTTDQDCQKFLPGCRTNKKGCVPNTSPCNVYSGTADICKGFKYGTCWNTSDAIENTPCIEKKCSDNIEATTDSECKAFLPECVTNLKGCISKEAGCSLYRGNQSTCSQFKGKNGTVNCWQITDASENTSCFDKTCNLNKTAINQQECTNFLEGCSFTGTAGCISSLEPCTSYKGDLKACQYFKGNGFKCWNDSTATSTTPCTQRTCADDMTSQTDSLCEASQHGCVTKGKGCIEATQQCEAYEGTQAQCEKFKGENGTVPCWNSQTLISTLCKVRKCIDSPAAKSNEVCEQFLKGCITNGQGCISPPQPCSYFSKLYIDCSNYIASDGPCKNSDDSDQCTPKVCSEAHNTVYTQEFCKTYHPSCISITTGCARQAPNCNNIKENLACALKTGCNWINNCRHIITDCKNEIQCPSTNSSSQICEPSTNSLKEYFWESGTCKIHNCETLPASYKTHQECQIVSICTTNGQGCVVMGPCFSYKSSRTCEAATSIENGKCKWDKITNSCNARTCKDSPDGYDTDEKCNNFLFGCKSNGKTCINTGFNCSELITADACIKDSLNNPCLFVEGKCYNYTKCTDIFRTTHQECQKFSDLCTTDGTQCIPMARCEDYTSQLSCVIGIDAECGWNPKLGIKNAFCSQLSVCPTEITNQSQCSQYNLKCISDGQKCIERAKCSEYITEPACQQDGIDGQCYFDKGICRLKECEDSLAFGLKSYEECKNFVKRIQCTTNTINCVPLKQCTSYKTPDECHIGIDGECGLFLPIGLIEDQTIEKPQKICRVRICEDTQSNNNEQCQEAYPVGKCITDGVQCILKKVCQQYTSEIACHIGGIDGACTYNSNICSLMTKCEDAKNDEKACNKEYCNYQPKVNGEITSSFCTPHTCQTKSLFKTECSAVISFDQMQLIPCITKSNSPCSEADPEKLDQENCNSITQNLYYWEFSEASSKCKICAVHTIDPIPTGVQTTQTIWGTILIIQLILMVMIS